MTPRSERLQPAVDQAHRKSEDALSQFATQQQQLARAEHQLDELTRYRNEYAAAGDGAVSVQALQNRQQFVARIDQAIAQQAAEIERQHYRLNRARDHWKQAHARESALDSVVAQHKEHERRAEDRREQADIDDRMQHRRPR